MNAILCHMSKECPLSGNLFYLIEYFFFLKKIDNSIKFILIDTSLNLNEICESKYTVKFEETDIIKITRNQIRSFRFKNIITTDRIYKYLNRLFFCEKAFIFQTWESLNDLSTREFIEKDKRCLIFNESGSSGCINYYRKINFQIYPQNIDNETSENNYFIHMPIQRVLTEEQFDNIYLNLDQTKNILIYSPVFFDYFKNYTNLIINTKPIVNLFQKFTDYLYTLPFGFDYSPRLLIECAFYKKNIINLRTNYKFDDGGRKRMEDAQNGNIKKYFLTIDDTLIQLFVE